MVGFSLLIALTLLLCFFIYLFIYLLQIHSTTLQANDEISKHYYKKKKKTKQKNKNKKLWRIRQPKAPMRQTRDAPPPKKNKKNMQVRDV